MALSVSSEWAFSGARITISKWCNQLQGDIVEALKYIKCLLHQDLLFHEVLNVAQVENELEGFVIDEEPGKAVDAVFKGDEFSWDSLLIDDVDLEQLVDSVD